MLLKATNTASRGWTVTYFPLHVLHPSQAPETKQVPTKPTAQTSARQDDPGLDPRKGRPEPHSQDLEQAQQKAQLLFRQNVFHVAE